MNKYMRVLLTTTCLCLTCINLSIVKDVHSIYLEMSPRGKECLQFQLEFKQGVQGTYEIFSKNSENRKDSVKVYFGHGNLINVRKYDDENLNLSKVTEQDFVQMADTSGTYSLCFINEANYAQVLGLDVHAINETNESSKEVATQSDTLELQNLGNKLREKVSKIENQQSLHFTRLEMYKDIIKTANSRMIWWTFLQAFIIILFFLLQLFYMRSFFESKTIV